MKIDIKKARISLILAFPLVDVIIAYMFHGDFLETVYSVVSITYIALYLFEKNLRRIDRSLLILFLIASINIVFQFLIEGMFSTAALNCTWFIVLAYTFFDNKERDELISTICQNKALVPIISILYCAVLVLTFLRGDAFYMEWNTSTLKGPYAIPHILAYELLVLIAVNFLAIMLHRTKIHIVILVILGSLLLLTATRGAILACGILLFFVIYTLNTQRKIVFFILGSFFFLVVFFGTDYIQILMASLLTKNQSAIASGNISNGRLRIWKSSIECFKQADNAIKWITGIGYTALLSGNKQNIGLRIQAHNDFITVFVCYGGIVFTVFLGSFFKLIKKSANKFLAFLFWAILAGTNGLVLYMPMVIGMLPVLTLFEKWKIIDKKVDRFSDEDGKISDYY